MQVALPIIINRHSESDWLVCGRSVLCLWIEDCTFQSLFGFGMLCTRHMFVMVYSGGSLHCVGVLIVEVTVPTT